MKFSILLPVHNGGIYIKECINSILSQTYTGFNLVVLENKSTDGTYEWLQTLQDDRVIIYPADQFLSIEKNWARITQVSKNEFMTLVGHDDLLHRDFLATMDKMISEDPGAALYHAHFTYIDDKGKRIRDCKPMRKKDSAIDFLADLMNNSVDSMGTGYVMRSKDYDAISGISLYPGLLFADFELWINLMRKSYRLNSPDQLFSFRIHQSTTRSSPDTTFHAAFEKFIYFLNALKNETREFREVIVNEGATFLLFYCKSLSHRLLRTPKKQRGNLTVKAFIEKCREYAVLLECQEKFQPDRVKSIHMARWIDATGLGRSIFRGFKRVWKKPVLK